jgi:hypothetical protein
MLLTVLKNGMPRRKSDFLPVLTKKKFGLKTFRRQATKAADGSI